MTVFLWCVMGAAFFSLCALVEIIYEHLKGKNKP